MVKVWYQPPPFGPRTALNRPSYGLAGDGGLRWVNTLSKMPPGRVICGFIAGFATLAYIPLSEFILFKSWQRLWPLVLFLRIFYVHYFLLKLFLFFQYDDKYSVIHSFIHLSYDRFI